MSVTPLDEFKKLLPPDLDLTESQIETMRDLIDMQADIILDKFLAHKENEILRSKNNDVKI